MSSEKVVSQLPEIRKQFEARFGKVEFQLATIAVKGREELGANDFMEIFLYFVAIGEGITGMGCAVEGHPPPKQGMGTLLTLYEISSFGARISHVRNRHRGTLKGTAIEKTSPPKTVAFEGSMDVDEKWEGTLMFGFPELEYTVTLHRISA